MQTKKQIEDWYSIPDPWKYETTPDDNRRREVICMAVSIFRDTYYRALDLGAGEGFITRALPAKLKYAYDISDNALGRLPSNVSKCSAPSGDYDLVIATGVLYEHYDWKFLCDIIRKHASGIVVVGGISTWEVKEAIGSIPGKQVFESRFPYRELQQKIRVFDVTR